MKHHGETARASRFRVSILAGGEGVVDSYEFRSFDVLLSWLAYWRVIVTDDGEELAAPYAHYSAILKDYFKHARADYSLRLNIYAGSVHLSPVEVLSLVNAYNSRKKNKRPSPFRDGPVQRTGKRGSHCYFRRGMRTLAERRESVSPADDCTEFPRFRTRRNRANLPSERADIPRCYTRSWKAMRRHQWRPE